MWKKTTLAFGISITVLGVLFFFYQYYDTLVTHEEDLGLSMLYLDNVTKINSAIIDLDFKQKQMQFTSNFFVTGNGLILDSNSKGFRDTDASCSDSLWLHLKDGGGQSLTWTDNKRLSISQYGEVEYIELTKVCPFNRVITPNGQFVVGLYGKNQTKIESVENIQFKTSFDSSEYDCKNECISSKNFVYYDNTNEERKTTTANLEGTDPDTRYMKFDLRTTNIAYEKLSNWFFISFQLGVGIAVSAIMFVFSNEQRKNIDGMIRKIADVAGQQQRIIDEENKKQKYRRKKYAKMLLFGLQLIDYEIEGMRIQQKFRDDKSDPSYSDDDRKKMQIEYYEKAQKRFLEINVEYDAMLEVFNPNIEEQYRSAWNTLKIPKLYFTHNFDDSEKFWKAISKIQTEFGNLRDLLIEYVDEQDRSDYKHLFDITKSKK